MSDRQQQPGGEAKPTPPHVNIQLDREHYTVSTQYLNGVELRSLASPAVPPERDLFEVVPGGADRKIGNEDVVQLRSGLRFFTTPAQINPGA
jgi:hypothetical protein